MKQKTAGTWIGRILLVLLVTLLLLLVAVVGVVYVVLRGPSVTAQELLTRSMKETSAIGFIPDLFLSGDRVAEIMSYREEDAGDVSTDASLVTVAVRRAPEQTGTPDPGQDGTPEDAGEDIEIVSITGAGYRGVMMIVKDPTRLFVGTPDRFGGVGLTLEEMINKYDAIGGVNGGGFYDPNGTGIGGIPEGIVISDGVMTWGSASTSSSVIGFDADGILHVGQMTGQQAMDRNLQWACSFGPALIVNGEAQTTSAITSSGVNPRTAIGQRADGAVLLLVVDGRQITSLGATLEDLISILLEHGAVNAANLDGGSSSQMFYEGEEMNNNISVKGNRPLPTTILVRR